MHIRCKKGPFDISRALNDNDNFTKWHPLHALIQGTNTHTNVYIYINVCCFLLKIKFPSSTWWHSQKRVTTLLIQTFTPYIPLLVGTKGKDIIAVFCQYETTYSWQYKRRIPWHQMFLIPTEIEKKINFSRIPDRGFVWKPILVGLCTYRYYGLLG